MKQYKRHLMFGHQPARPETIEYQYFGTRWKSIQHQVKIKRLKLRYNLLNDLSKVWNLMAVPCPSWVCPWQIGKLPPNHEVRIIPEVKYLDADWYGVWIFNFDLYSRFFSEKCILLDWPQINHQTWSRGRSDVNCFLIGTFKKVYVRGTTPSILHLYALTGWGPNFRGLCSRTLSRPL